MSINIHPQSFRARLLRVLVQNVGKTISTTQIHAAIRPRESNGWWPRCSEIRFTLRTLKRAGYVVEEGKDNLGHCLWRGGPMLDHWQEQEGGE